MLKTVINCHVCQNQAKKVLCTVLLNYLHTFVFDVFSIYLINIRYWQVLFITQDQLGKSQSATSTFKCWGTCLYFACILFVCIFRGGLKMCPFIWGLPNFESPLSKKKCFRKYILPSFHVSLVNICLVFSFLVFFDNFIC